MSSHPTYDPGNLNQIGTQLNKDPEKPLINRATQGLYPTGTMIEPFVQALYGLKPVTQADTKKVYETFSFYRAPLLRMGVAEPISESEAKDLHVSPLQVALAAAA
jgi:cell division protein FtsI/penicillin-binding protein 2